jgi:hypothetical protein
MQYSHTKFRCGAHAQCNGQDSVLSSILVMRLSLRHNHTIRASHSRALFEHLTVARYSSISQSRAIQAPHSRALFEHLTVARYSSISQSRAIRASHSHALFEHLTVARYSSISQSRAIRAPQQSNKNPCAVHIPFPAFVSQVSLAIGGGADISISPSRIHKCPRTQNRGENCFCAMYAQPSGDMASLSCSSGTSCEFPQASLVGAHVRIFLARPMMANV